MADPIDIMSLLGGDPQVERRKALIAAIRGQGAQPQMQPQGDSDFARLGQLSGDKVLSGFGSGLIQDAQQQQQQIGIRQNQGLQRAMQAQQIANEQKYRQDETTNRAEQLKIQKQLAEQGRFTTTQDGAIKINTRTGELSPTGFAPRAPKGAAGADAKAEEALKKDFDYALNRSGQPGKDEDLKASADKIKRLTIGPDGKPNFKLTVRQVPELIQAVNSLISNGGAGTQGQFEHMMPSTWGSDWAKKVEYITGHPEDANLEAFVKQAYETAEREAKGANERQFENRRKRAPFHQEYFDKDPANVIAKVRAYLPGLDDQQINDLFHGKYTPKEVAAATEPNHSAALDWAKANPTDPRAAEIIKRAGGK